ncbi:MAG TPA: translocation/assembly module TamB domain-containing protein [Bryobacteraceae bacterium]|nr:translocation/assembly module TamB domain-containing protein [Bryobacteraceae bacterium]
MTRLNRTIKRTAAALVIVAAALAIAASLVFQSGWFRERVRERIVQELEKGSGGRVELGNFSFDWHTLEATVAPLILHGTESAAEPPLVRIEKISIGLRVISALERRVDLSSVRLDRPSVYVAVYPDGKTNLPEPQGAQDSTSWAGHLVDFAVRSYEVTGGLVEYDHRRLPVDLRGEDLRMELNFDAAAKRYRGEFASRHVHLASALATPAEFDTAATFTLERDRLSFTRLHLASGQSRADLAGALTGLRAPAGDFRLKALIATRDVVAMFSLPLEPAGSAAVNGTLAVSLGTVPDFTLDARATARGLGYARDRVRIDNASASAGIVWNPHGVNLRGLSVEALGARFVGSAALTREAKLHVEGNFEDLQLADAIRALTPRAVPWSAKLAGGLTLDTEAGGTSVQVDTTSMLAPVTGSPSLSGEVAAHYDQKAGVLRFGNSRLATGSTDVAFSGVPGQQLDVRARSANLDDVLPALALLGEPAPHSFPLKLNGGEISASGTLSGGTFSSAAQNVVFHGDAAVTKATVQGHAFDSFSAQVDANAGEISLHGIDLARGATEVRGDAAITARNGRFDDGAITARLDVRNASIPELMKEAGLAGDIRGTATASARVSGTVRNPEADVTLDVLQAAALGERFDRLRGNVHYVNGSVRVNNGEATLGPGRLNFSGSYQAGLRDWTRGDLGLDLNAQAVAFGRIAALHSLLPNLEARLEGKFALRARLDPGAFEVRELNGEGAARGLTLSSEALGDVTLAAETHGADLALRATAKFRDASVQGQGTWRLEGDIPGSATLQFSRLTVASLHDLVMIGATEREKSVTPPFAGFVEGGATLSIPLRRPERFQAEARIETVQFTPLASQVPRLDIAAGDIVLRNAQPVLISITAHEARVRSARFTARDTNLEVNGAVPIDSTGGADFSVQGGVDLAILQLLNPDLLARGGATVSAAVRGSLRDPQVNGRMELKNASLYLKDLPSGVDSASGVILFDRNRANVESLVAETGGGKVALTGFLEFAQPLVYRLQADVRQVRVRYPEDVSMTVSAQLSLYGTSEASTLAGTLTLNRAAISTGADLGKMLAAGSRPTPAPAAGDYLSGIRFDVRVQGAPALQLETSLTRNVQASVDLRLRGTPAQPVLLGEISVNSGEVEIFGNRYSVNRGEIRFLDPVKIEPTLDVNLETSTRGITVNVSLSGSPQKLNVNYSSDPPLQSRDIIALLAVGRDPNSTTAVSNAATSSSTTGFTDAGGVLGQAVSEQLSNRLQRFFGASRVKIDPTLTGVDNLPEARLTFEQQVSRDVNLTYITNLNRTQEQIVRLEWDFSPIWSAVAVRNSNGLFGIDLQYRKRFK